jgi:hypothetical protein
VQKRRSIYRESYAGPHRRRPSSLFSPSLRMPEFPSSSISSNPSPLIPDLFHQQKHYIFRALEADAFPRFLRAKAFANLSPAGSFWRLVLGLLVLWGGFVLGFSLIFLDRQPRAQRVWVSLLSVPVVHPAEEYRSSCLSLYPPTCSYRPTIPSRLCSPCSSALKRAHFGRCGSGRGMCES